MMMGKDLMEHYDFGGPIIIHNELQKALGKTKTNTFIRQSQYIKSQIKL